jgi:hypothetical protein
MEELINPIITAIIAGIIASSKQTAAQAIKEGYNGFRNFISSRFNINFSDIEQRSITDNTKKQLQIQLKDGKLSDIEVAREEAIKFTKIIEQNDSEIVSSVNVILTELKIGGSLKIDNVVSEKIGIDVTKAEIVEDLLISNLHN